MMNWKEIQTQWKTGEEVEKTTFSIPNKRRLELIGNEMKYFQQDHGRIPSIIMGSFSLLLAVSCLFFIDPDKNRLFYMGFLFLLVSLSQFARVLFLKNLFPDTDMKSYLTQARNAVRWVRIQQALGLLIGIIFIPYISFTQQDGAEQWETLKLLLILAVPIGTLGFSLYWWYQKHHNYNLGRLDRQMTDMLRELESEEKF